MIGGFNLAKFAIEHAHNGLILVNGAKFAKFPPPKLSAIWKCQIKA